MSQCHLAHESVKGLLTLRALLLGRNDLEVTIVERALLLLLLLLLRVGVALLGNLAPATTRLVISRAGCVALVDNALVGKLTAAQELFSKVATINVVGRSMDRFRDELKLRREDEEGRDEVVGYSLLA